MTTGRALAVPTQARLRVLGRDYGLDDRQLAALAALLRLIATDPLAPTTVRDPEASVDQHLADALVALELAQVRGAQVAADLGAGAGLPGLALAAALPSCRWTLVESVTRKALFIDRAIEMMGLANAQGVNLRAEEWRAGRQVNELITARAVAAAPVVLEYAAPLLCLGGSFVDWRTEMAPQEDGDARAAADLLGLERIEARRVTPFTGARSRFLYVYVKVRDTPDRFPRRVGSARKRPLGSSTRG